MELLITTNPGLESLLAAEIGERSVEVGTGQPQGVKTNPRGLRGAVLAQFDTSVAAVWPAVRRLRSAHHVMQPLDDFELHGDGEDALVEIERRVERLDIPGLEARNRFRVTCKRNGRHAFTSQDVQRAAGAGAQRRSGAPVDLEHYECHVRVDVIGRRCLVGVQLTDTSLSKRYPRVFNPSTALKPNIAFAMLRWTLGHHDHDGTLLDPFCGAGTILLEAAAVQPRLALYGSDIDARCLAGTRTNAQAVNPDTRFGLRRADARHSVEAWGRQRFDWIVTDPPYGVRLGRRWDFDRFYRRFLEQAHDVLKPTGRLAMLVYRRGTFERALAETHLFTVADMRAIDVGGLTTRLYVMDKQGESDNGGMNR